MESVSSPENTLIPITHYVSSGKSFLLYILVVYFSLPISLFLSLSFSFPVTFFITLSLTLSHSLFLLSTYNFCVIFFSPFSSTHQFSFLSSLSQCICSPISYMKLNSKIYSPFLLLHYDTAREVPRQQDHS